MAWKDRKDKYPLFPTGKIHTQMFFFLYFPFAALFFLPLPKFLVGFMACFCFSCLLCFSTAFSMTSEGAADLREKLKTTTKHENVQANLCQHSIEDVLLRLALLASGSSQGLFGLLDRHLVLLLFLLVHKHSSTRSALRRVLQLRRNSCLS